LRVANEMASRRSSKIQDIIAHNGKTNCVHIGRHSAALLVTGGDDGLVNIWAVGRPGAIYSLQGHTSPVTSVRYDMKEEMVLAGSRSASVKLYDLETAKQVRTVTGHRSEITALDFHAVGNWFATGSMDTNWKLWDKRQRSCTATFKGHSESITHVLFSPPGKWVVTGSKDGVVKVSLTETNVSAYNILLSMGSTERLDLAALGSVTRQVYSRDDSYTSYNLGSI
jgi:katanin p80 WD40 repeat-containing subunit B1